MTTSAVDGVRALAASAVAQVGLILEDVAVLPAGRRRLLRVVVDLPEGQLGGVSLDAVAAASQAVSAALDGSEVMGAAPYVLEVTSPGVDRPLTERRHFARARGRTVRLLLRGGEELTGRLRGVDDSGVRLGERVLAWEHVARGHVEVEFAREPLDADTPGDVDTPADEEAAP